MNLGLDLRNAFFKIIQRGDTDGGNDSELLNAVYKKVSEKLGMDAAMEIYQIFKGQRINFPVRCFNPLRIQQIIVKEYHGKHCF